MLPAAKKAVPKELLDSLRADYRVGRSDWRKRIAQATHQINLLWRIDGILHRRRLQMVDMFLISSGLGTSSSSTNFNVTNTSTRPAFGTSDSAVAIT